MTRRVLPFEDIATEPGECADTCQAVPLVCEYCNGEGFDPTGDGTVLCPECQGSGMAPTEEPESLLDDVLAELRSIEDQLADLTIRKKALREVLMDQVAESRSKRVERPLATVRMMPGYERVSYDRKGLDGLAASRPDIAPLLAPHRRVSVTSPSVRVEWQKGA